MTISGPLIFLTHNGIPSKDACWVLYHEFLYLNTPSTTFLISLSLSTHVLSISILKGTSMNFYTIHFSPDLSLVKLFSDRHLIFLKLWKIQALLCSIDFYLFVTHQPISEYRYWNLLSLFSPLVMSDLIYLTIVLILLLVS